MKISAHDFRNHFHVCAFVRSAEEERDIVESFFVDGMSAGCRACYIVDPDEHAQHTARLKSLAPREDLAEVTTWHDAHLKGGSFDQGRMMTLLDELLQENAARGEPPMRIVGQMGWVFSNPPPDLVEYEATVNEVLNRGKAPTICVYDVRRLSGALMMDLMRAHPLTIMNGMLHENPFYTPADELLRDLRARAT